MQDGNNFLAGILRNAKNKLSSHLDVTRFDFYFLCLAVLAINIPYLSPSFLPQHDALSTFEMYYFFYNEFFFHNTIAQWIPYGTYGNLPSSFQLSALTPITYVLFCLGKIFSVKDVLFIFKLDLLLAQFMFLTGLYYLSRLLFKHTSTVMTVCLASFCSFVWFYQLFFNFKIYYLFPWVTYFLVLYVKHRRPMFFGMSFLICWVWTIGNCLYFIGLWLLILTLMTVILIFKNRGLLQAIWPRKYLFLFSVSLLFIVLFFYFAKSPYDATVITLRPVDGVNTIQTFLQYGGTAELGMAVHSFTFRHPPFTILGMGVDNTVYAGLLMAYFFLWAAMFVRVRFCVALLVAFFALLLFSLGGIFSMVAYYFPGMKFYRHIGLVYPWMKIILVLCAGFGLEDFWQSGWKERLKKFFSVLLLYGVLLDVVPECRDLFLDSLKKIFVLGHPWNIATGNMLFNFMVYFWLLIIGLYFLSRGMGSAGLKKDGTDVNYWDKAWAIFFIAFLCLDIFLYQGLIFSRSPRLSAEAQRNLPQVVKVNQLDFLERRSPKLVTERQKEADAIERETLNLHSAKNAYGFYSFTQTDPCFPDKRLLSLGWTVNVFYLFGTLDPNDLSYAKIYACEEPKLRLVSKAVFLDTELEIRKSLKGRLPDRFVYLKRRNADEGREKDLTFGIENVGQVKAVDFTTDRLTLVANVIPPKGAWLTYADSYYPGWKAFVDGKPEPIYEANLAFKAVHLTPGQHIVKFVFTNGIIRWCSYLWAILGLFFGTIFIYIVLAKIICNFDLTGYILKKSSSG